MYPKRFISSRDSPSRHSPILSLPTYRSTATYWYHTVCRDRINLARDTANDDEGLSTGDDGDDDDSVAGGTGSYDAYFYELSSVGRDATNSC